MSSNVSNLQKKRKADSHATADGSHDVNTGKGHNNDDASTNDDNSFLSSGRRDETSQGPPQDDNKPSQLDRMENIMMRMEETSHREQPRESVWKIGGKM